ncbi:lymphocyte function-associated antigen 3 [Phaethornis superciliosus]
MIESNPHIHCKDVFGITGENFTFPVKIDKKMEEITWKKNKNKVAEWDLETETIYYSSLHNRSLLHTENGSLTIFNLEKSDAGTYVLECLHSVEEFILAVFAPPPEPEISCNISGDYFVLKCAADFLKPLDYAWNLSNSPLTAQTQDFILSRKNVDASERATCFIKVSQTEKISAISLTQCFSEETDKELNKEDSHLKDKEAVYNDVNQEEVTQDAEGGNEEDVSSSPRCSKEGGKQ